MVYGWPLIKCKFVHNSHQRPHGQKLGRLRLFMPRSEDSYLCFRVNIFLLSITSKGLQNLFEVGPLKLAYILKADKISYDILHV